jgi:hypothetical protein
MGKKERRAALVRVTKKLSALRSTLKKDERELLDRIVLGAAEVAGHAVTAEVFSKRELPSKRESPAKTDEVMGHAATEFASKRELPSKRESPAKTDEVMGHAATEFASKRELPSKRESPARVDLPAKIEYDAKKKTYVVAD